MVRIRRALVSVSRKDDVVSFARGLRALDIEILSTGGTFQLLKEHGVTAALIEKEIDFPEILDGRVKTLHPKIHGAILALRDKKSHTDELARLNIMPIDLVCVNLYPFEEKSSGGTLPLSDMLEEIDIGGVCLLRAAAKNYRHVAVISGISQYEPVLDELRENNGCLSKETLGQLAVKALGETSRYDRFISAYLDRALSKEKQTQQMAGYFPDAVQLQFMRERQLRYGENPHQAAALYREADGAGPIGIFAARKLHGKELSYNNILDLESAYTIAYEFDEPAAVVIKHGNPCGAALGAEIEGAFQDALEGDSLSAFGGIVGINRTCDIGLAERMLDAGFLECIIAPQFTQKALTLLTTKKNLRLLELAPGAAGKSETYHLKKITGGLLIQEKDSVFAGELSECTVATTKAPTGDDMKALAFAWRIARFVRSNAIVIADGLKTIGIGAGQMSRVDAVRIAAEKAGGRAQGAVLASDAFFPMPDNIEVCADAGIRSIIQPGGSIKDQEVIEACNKAGIAMVFTGRRHFRH
ncbi:MAG: bifunctional phosphoribosylaminoimidazolecarboxamide formyltransferase/IMP cyclohydrolase [Candidatus Omnitrophica bacterium]|nr:bifunctional phosphoribosylaminoimidazolecarboxamide formyltransferase/IMP cyclohydrolase [Candidatus Omnitrophota bacterium]